MNIPTRIKSLRLYEQDILKIKERNINTSKFLRYVENQYIKQLNKDSQKILKLYDNYINNYDTTKTKIITYNGITTNNKYTRKYLTCYLHYNLSTLLKRFK